MSTVSWNSVLDNAGKQHDQARQVATRDEITIESLYPELHTGEAAGLFVNNSGSHLIGDLLTAPRVVVDLYPFLDEGELIRIYGVDRKYLIALRDQGLIILAANADLMRFEPVEWMHDILADTRTLFRSIRTPIFFEALFPSIIDERESLKKDLRLRFERMTPSEQGNFIGRFSVQQESKDLEVISAQLSWEWLRVEKLTSKAFEDSDEESIDGYSLEDILYRPDSHLNLLHRDFHLAVSPHSGALGGAFRISDKAVRTYFPDVLSQNELFSEYQYIRDVHNWLVRLAAGVEPSDLSSEEYWQRLSAYERARLLELLIINKEERESAMTADRNLRGRIARLDKTIEFDEIYQLVQGDARRVEKLKGISQLGYTAATSVFGYFVAEYFGFAGGLGSIAAVTGGQIVKSRLQKTLEFVFPRLQVANFVRRNTAR